MNKLRAAINAHPGKMRGTRCNDRDTVIMGEIDTIIAAHERGVSWDALIKMIEESTGYVISRSGLSRMVERAGKKS